MNGTVFAGTDGSGNIGSAAQIAATTIPPVVSSSSVSAPIVSSTFPPVIIQSWQIPVGISPPSPTLPTINVIRGPAINITPPTPLISGQAKSKNVLIQYQSDGPINAPT